MRSPLPLALLLLLALGAASAIHAQITNPIQAPVVKRGLSVEVRDLVRLPETRGFVPPIRTWYPLAGRGSLSSGTFRTAAGSPTTRAGSVLAQRQ